MNSPPTRRSAPVGSTSHGASRQASSGHKRTTDAPNDPPVDHQDEGWWLALMGDGDRGLFVQEADA